MRPQIKLATCCYCSARTMLKPTARDGHELACGSCGAPLHEMKWLKSPEPAAPKRKGAKPAPRPTPYRAEQARYEKPRKYKKRKPFWRKALEEVWDEIEDIFD
ncbi:hypothetical protein C8N43_2923 [Litoreibacter ponti]|uniref:Uncharacterized protein n=1 Tax=Litoreibacter ponti TaxID=1510457 RepID=A0A2T6BDG5_9RHOB|nr:hypothetical protein [Litoreibacter ponti]PTX54117.1 hypothetical protein C8N43_2923 [Litoreibacter ponti]